MYLPNFTEQEPTASRAPEARGPDVLYVTHRVPYPPDKGDRIRNYHLLRHLSRHAAVHLATLADDPIPAESVEALDRLCARVAIIPVSRWSSRTRAAASLLAGGSASEGAFASPRLRAVLRRWARQTRFHATLASASSVSPYLRLPELRNVPAVVDLVDVDSQKWLDYAATGRGPRSWLYRVEGHRIRRLERSLLGWVRAVTLVSEAEAELYRGLGPSPAGAVLAVTNGVDLAYFSPSAEPANTADCVFVGALDYRPNIDGVRWFCRKIWPEIFRRRPDARFRVVGRNPSPEVARLATLPGVDLVGPVLDVRPELARAAVVVIPLRIARGVQNKVLEALAMGKAVVASPQAIAGLGVEPYVHLRVASSPTGWREGVNQLLDDPKRRRELGSAGRRYVHEAHRWDCCLRPFESVLVLPDGQEAVGPGSERPDGCPRPGHMAWDCTASDRRDREYHR